VLQLLDHYLIWFQVLRLLSAQQGHGIFIVTNNKLCLYWMRHSLLINFLALSDLQILIHRIAMFLRALSVHGYLMLHCLKVCMSNNSITPSQFQPFRPFSHIICIVSTSSKLSAVGHLVMPQFRLKEVPARMCLTPVTKADLNTIHPLTAH